MVRPPEKFQLIVSAAGIAFVGIVALALAIFRDSSVAASGAFGTAAIPGLVFILASSIVVGRNAKTYRLDFLASQEKPERYKAALKALGDLPLGSLSLFMIFIIAYLAVLFPLSGAIGVQPSGRVPFFLFLLSTGMLDAAFLFILADRTGSKVLLDRRLVRYPIDLRESRQQRKNFIIPTFMSLMTFLFAFSVALLVIRLDTEGRRGNRLRLPRRRDRRILHVLRDLDTPRGDVDLEYRPHLPFGRHSARAAIGRGEGSPRQDIHPLGG